MPVMELTAAQYAALEVNEKLGTKGILTAELAAVMLGIANATSLSTLSTYLVGQPSQRTGYERVYSLLKSKLSGKENAADGYKYHLVISDIPGLQAVSEAENGEGLEYIVRTLRDRFFTKINSSVRNVMEVDKINLPYEVTDFIRARVNAGFGVSIYAPFKAVAKGIVDKLKAGGIAINEQKLRNCLEDANMATALFPKIPQANWDGLLQSLANKAATEDDREFFIAWLRERYNAKANVDINGFDVDSLLA